MEVPCPNTASRSEAPRKSELKAIIAGSSLGVDLVGVTLSDRSPPKVRIVPLKYTSDEMMSVESGFQSVKIGGNVALPLRVHA